MTTNIQIITDALREIGVISEAETPSAEQGEHALRSLNQLLEEWEEKDIRLEYFAQSSTTDTCPIPAYAERAVKLALAIEEAPTYGATVSVELAAKALDAYNTVSRVAMNRRLRPARADLPLGNGHAWNIMTDS